MEAMKAIYDLDFHSIEGAITSFSIGIHSDDGTLSTELNVGGGENNHPPVLSLYYSRFLCLTITLNAPLLCINSSKIIFVNLQFKYPTSQLVIIIMHLIFFLQNCSVARQR